MSLLNKYIILDKICEGGFGSIYKGENKRTKEQVVIKVEDANSELKTLKREAQLYQYLGKHEGIPSLKWYGTIDNLTYIVLPLFSFSLNKIPSNAFSLIDAFQISKKMIDILEYVHEKGFIHRDVKPDNFCFDIETKKLYIIDFGLCKKYIRDDGYHIDSREGRHLLGTPNYVSLNVHDGMEPSRRDDMESIGYILFKLLQGELGWEYENDYVKIRTQKANLWSNPDIDIRVKKYLELVRSLGFSNKPNYDLLKVTLNSI
jgi:serine/threonine protein kinase